MKSLLFISSVNLSLNPRILKEVQLALKAGMDVSFIGFKMGNWSDVTEKKILNDLPRLKTFYLSATRKPFLPWLVVSIAQWLSIKLYFFSKNNIPLNVIACSKRSILLYLQTVKLAKTNKYDIVIAHTLPALSTAYFLYKKRQIPFGFDVEDYHPGEKIETDVENEKRRRCFLMQYFLPCAAYISAASPSIAGEVSKLIPGRNVINFPNFFPKEEFIEPEKKFPEKIKLIWFSQNINYGRGLELLLPALDSRFELTIIGKLDKHFYEKYIEPNTTQYNVNILEPVSQQNLHTLLSAYDIGLALEVSSADFNREIALTNKIIAYFQAGLYILATNTKAQCLFLNEHESHGLVCDQSYESITRALNTIASTITTIRQERVNRFYLSQNYNWETLEPSLLKLWNDL